MHHESRAAATRERTPAWRWTSGAATAACCSILVSACAEPSRLRIANAGGVTVPTVGSGMPLAHDALSPTERLDQACRPARSTPDPTDQPASSRAIAGHE